MSICANRTGAGKKKNYAITKKYLIPKQQCLLHCPLSYKRILLFICTVVFINALPWNPVTCLKTLMNIKLQIRQTYWPFVNTYLARICNECYVLFLLLWMLCSVYSVFIMPTGTLRLPWLRFIRTFFLSCKANARVQLTKTGHGPHSSQLGC
jgi:hypothetical protein